MRIALVAFFLAALAVPASAEARRPGDPPAARPDSARTLTGPWQLWTHAGIGWLSAPAEVRKRYAAGLDLGLSGDRRFADRIAFRARLDFDDLPSSRPAALVVNGDVLSISDFGHAWMLHAAGGGALRVWNHLWLEGEAGPAYFNSGFGADDTIEDSATGTTFTLNGSSGWGTLWAAGARYEFQPGKRDRMLAEIRFATMDRDGVQLRTVTLRAGYRAF